MARKIRIECEQRTKAGGVLKDLRTGVQPYFYRGEAITLELCLFANGRMLRRAEITNLKVRWKSGTETLSETVVAGASLSSSLTAQQWRQGNAALALVNFAEAATGDLSAGMLTLEVAATLTDGESVFASGTVESVTLPGLIVGTPPTPSPPTSWTKAEANALFDPIGSSTGLAAAIGALEVFTGLAGEVAEGGFVRNVSQSFNATQQEQARTNIGAAVNGGLRTIPGASDAGIPDSDILYLTPDASISGLTKMTPDVNTTIGLLAPTLAVGVPHALHIQQGFPVEWASAYTFPDYEITNGAASGAYTKKSWHPETGEGYDRFELLNDGTTTHVRRFRHAARPDSIVDFEFNRPFTVGSITTQYDRDLTATTTGGTGTFGTYGALTGSGIGAGVFAGSGDLNFAVPQIPYAQGYAIAVVFEATASSADAVLFRLAPLGVEATMQTSGGNNIRFKPIGSSSTAGLTIGLTFGAPIAAVIVVRPAGAGAFVLSTSDLAGGNTGSFSPAVASGTTGYMGGNAGTNYLTCKIARFRLISVALTPDQARAELDALTAAYKIG